MVLSPDLELNVWIPRKYEVCTISWLNSGALPDIIWTVISRIAIHHSYFLLWAWNSNFLLDLAKGPSLEYLLRLSYLYDKCFSRFSLQMIAAEEQSSYKENKIGGLEKPENQSLITIAGVAKLCPKIIIICLIIIWIISNEIRVVSKFQMTKPILNGLPSENKLNYMKNRV